MVGEREREIEINCIRNETIAVVTVRDKGSTMMGRNLSLNNTINRETIKKGLRDEQK